MPESPRQKVIRVIQNRIGNASYTPQMRLPSDAKLAEELEVSRGTVRNALAEMAEAGILVAKPNRGFFVPTIPVSSSVPKRHICFVLPAEARRLVDRYVYSLEKAASQAQAVLKVMYLQQEPEQQDYVIEQLRTTGNIGVVFLPVQRSDFYEYNSRIVRRISMAGINHVVIDSQLSSTIRSLSSFVGADGFNASRDIVDYLVEAGHSRIATIQVFPESCSTSERIQGIREQLFRHGISTPAGYDTRIEQDMPLPQQGRQQLRELMSLPEPPTAVICSHDVLAFNVIDELRKMKLCVPEDVSVVGFDNSELATLLELTTVEQPFHEIGQRAVEILLEKSADARCPIRQEFLPCRLILRKTVAIIRKA